MKAIQQSDSDYLESFSRLTNFFPRPHSLCLKWSNAEKSINRTKLENVDRLKPLFLSASDDNMVYDSPSLVSNLPSSSQPRLNPNFFFFFSTLNLLWPKQKGFGWNGSVESTCHYYFNHRSLYFYTWVRLHIS